MSPPATAWAAIAPEWANPPFFIHTGAVGFTRREVHNSIGSAWSRQGETWREGWRRAYRRGWRVKRVEIRVLA